MVAEGVIFGTVLVKATIDDKGIISGNANRFSKICGSIDYHVNGRVAHNRRTIILRGVQDLVDSTCGRSLSKEEAVLRSRHGSRHRQGAQAENPPRGFQAEQARNAQATVAAIEYDPMRWARLALLGYHDLDSAPVGIKVGLKISSGPTAPPEIGNALPLKAIPVSTAIHNLELTPGRGGQVWPPWNTYATPSAWGKSGGC